MIYVPTYMKESVIHLLIFTIHGRGSLLEDIMLINWLNSGILHKEAGILHKEVHKIKYRSVIQWW